MRSLWEEVSSKQEFGDNSTSKLNIYRLAPILCVYFGYQYKIPFEKMVHSMAKTVQKPQSLLIRAILQGVCASVKLYWDNHTLSIRSRLTQLGNCWRKASTMSFRWDPVLVLCPSYLWPRGMVVCYDLTAPFPHQNPMDFLQKAVMRVLLIEDLREGMLGR